MGCTRVLARCSVAVWAISSCGAGLPAQTKLSDELLRKIDAVATDSLAKTGVPSASVAIVKNGQIVYLHAYGNARLAPQLVAKPEMRYSIGSVSKQFLATSILLLREQGKLSLDDHVGKFLPGLTRANEVTIRQLLSHTSGYQDYWPQDYVIPAMLKPATARQIVDIWARKPLDFEPGTKWQYSNTNFVIAGLIVEKASGESLWKFLNERIFTPLDMKSVADIDAKDLGDNEPLGYQRYGLGEPRPAPRTGYGWLFAAGELAMTAEDLAKWDLSIIQQKILKPSSYRDFETEVLLKDGLGSRYGLGVEVKSEFGCRELTHSGEVSGFTSENAVFPDEQAAIVALTNQDSSDAAGAILRGIKPLLLSNEDAATSKKLAQAQRIFEGLQHGTVDRALFTENGNFYFNAQALKDFAASLGPLGTPQEFSQVSEESRGGMIQREYKVTFPKIELRAWSYELPDGKLEQYEVAAKLGD
jgi:D-alanyl-D-alanine carboxypeptidase